MALKPEQISGLRDAFSAIAEPINDWLLQDAAERIAAAGALAGEPAGKMTATAAYEIYRAKALGESQRELKKFLKHQLGLSNREVRRLFKQAARMSRDNDEERVGLTGGADIEQMTAAAIKLAQQDFTNLTQTLGMMAPGGKVLPLRQFYQKSMDFAFKQIFTGAADYETAIRQATTKMADAGVRTIDCESGRSISLEAAVRRNMMGGMGLLDEQITQANHDAFGCNGWEISAHANSAPDHEPIQGRQYSDKDFKELESRLTRRIGTLNCGHVKMPILLGINSPQYTEEQLRAFQEDNAKGITYEGKHYTGYEATQKQRQLECAQRVQKNRILVSRSTGDALREQTAQIRLQMLRQHYKAFSKAAGLPLQEERTWVAGGDWEKTADAEALKFYVADSRDVLKTITKRSTIKLKSGFACFPDGDPLNRNVQSVLPLEGYFDVAMHGTPRAVSFGGHDANMSPKTLASVIRHNKNYKGQNIRLLSCSTGKIIDGNYCFAEELANALGVQVLAPDDVLYITNQGVMWIGDSMKEEFTLFKPNQRRRVK